jgi:transposase InsO family protein
MSISTSAFYYKPKKSRTVRDFNDAQLREAIESIQEEFPCAGYRTVQTYLYSRQRRWYNGKKIRRVMGKYGLQARIRKAFVRTTDSDHGLPVYPNLIAGMIVTGVNQLWVADITYIRIATGFVYLAVILDVFSRRIVGWAISKSLDRRLTIGALKMAIALRNPPPGIIHHSDRGVQYACQEYVDLLTLHQFKISMSRSGNPYDNAFAESFMKTLKKEEVYLWEYESFVDVAERIPYFIEEVYNRKRVHSGINYLPPVEFESILADEKRRKELGQINLKISGKAPA